MRWEFPVQLDEPVEPKTTACSIRLCKTRQYQWNRKIFCNSVRFIVRCLIGQNPKANQRKKIFFKVKIKFSLTFSFNLAMINWKKWNYFVSLQRPLSTNWPTDRRETKNEEIRLVLFCSDVDSFKFFGSNLFSSHFQFDFFTVIHKSIDVDRFKSSTGRSSDWNQRISTEKRHSIRWILDFDQSSLLSKFKQSFWFGSH